jgi:WD40 repeat protein
MTSRLSIKDHDHSIEIACFSADGSRLLTVREVGVAQIWDVASGSRIGEIRPTSPLEGRLDLGPWAGPFRVFIEAVALNHNGDLALLGLNDGTAGVFSLPDGSRLSTLHAPDTEHASSVQLVRAVTFSPDGSLVAVGFRSRSAGVWKTPGDELLRFLRKPGPGRWVTGRWWPRNTLVLSLSISEGNRYLFAGCGDTTATIWDLHTGVIVFDAFEHAEEILDLFVQGERVRWVTTGGTIWETSADQAPARRLTTEASWQDAIFSPDGQVVLARTSEGHLQRWTEDGKGELLAERAAKREWLFQVPPFGFDRTGKLCYFPEAPDRLALATDRHRGGLQRDHEIIGAVLSPRGDVIATQGWSPQVELWSVPSGELIGSLDHDSAIGAMAFSPDGSLLAVGVLGEGGPGDSRDIAVWEVAGRRLVCRLRGHRHQVHSLVFGPDGRWLVSASLDCTVRLWSLRSGFFHRPRELRRLDYSHMEFLAGLDFHTLIVLSDGRILIFTAKDIEIWCELRRLLHRIPLPHPYSLRRRWKVTSDEQCLLGSMRRQHVGVWSLDSGQLLHLYQPDILCPDVVPGEPLWDELKPSDVAMLWHGPGGPYVHALDRPRGWRIPLRLSQNEKLIAVPCQSGAALVSLDGSHQSVVSHLPFEGRLRASCITRNRVLMVNSAGKLFTSH